MRYLHRSPEREARKIRARFDTSSTSELPSNPKAASRSVTQGQQKPHLHWWPSPRCHNAGRFSQQQETEEVGWAVGAGESRSRSKLSRSSPCQTSQVTPQTYSLSLPLQLCTTRKGFTVTDYSEYTKIPHRIAKNFVLSSAERKPRTRETGS